MTLVAKRTGALVGGLIGLWILLAFVLPHVLSAQGTTSHTWQSPFAAIMLGLINGATYGLLAVGLVLVYRSTRIVNFAHGEVGAFAASFFGLEVVKWHLPYWVALLPALIVAAAVGAVLDAVVVRRMRKAPLVMSVVATLAAGQFLFLFSQVINSRAASGLGYPQPSGLPTGHIGALLITPSYSGILILAPIAVIALGVFLKNSRYGRGIRSAASNPEAARMAGIPVARMSSMVWALAGVLAALSAILTEPAQGFQSGDTFGPSLLLIAMTGAVLGRMKSLSGAMIGGLAVGVTEQLLNWNYSDKPGLPEVALFVGIMIALLVQRQQIGRGEDKGAWSVTQAARPLPAQVRALPSVKVLAIAPWVILAVVLGVLPLMLSNGTSIELAITFAFVIVALSISLITGLGGQLSLGQFAIGAVGAFASYEISRRTGNFVESFAYAGAAGAAISVLLGIPAIRARGLMLTVTTLAFALIMPDYIIGRPWFLGEGKDPGRPIIHGHAITSGHGYYYVALATLAFALLVTANVRRGGIARRLIAVRDNENAARAFTVPATTVKLQGYALAGFLAGVGGAMYGHSLALIGPDGFPASASIDSVKIAVIGGLGTLAGPLLGAGLVQVVGYVTLGALALALLSLAQLLVILFLPGGLAQITTWIRDVCAKALAARAGIDFAAAEAAERGITEASTTARPLPEFARPAHRRVSVGGVLLDVSGLRKSYDGIHAVAGVDLSVMAGETLGLIGPNGAGKTTTFELVAGFVSPDAGTVHYRGRDITSMSPEGRGRLGMIRSFQDAALFPTLTVAECVALSLERLSPTSIGPALLGLRGADRRKLAQADEMLEWMGLLRYRSSQIQELSTGTRRIAEIACLVALQPELLLLDEPSSGVAQRETEALGELLSRLKSELSLTMVVIEHDIPLVMGLSDRVVCMADGHLIAAGTPAEIQANPAVIEAYLGGALPEPVRAPRRTTAAAPRRAPRRAKVAVGGASR